ncbi:thioesterase-like superfamily-domain-containing protein [Mycena pura]|uniref:Thioesterase-like superfamily-domain-containing protein n=1 Tax=Mycena pura TaxID=153505 RepID=A0AAD6VIH6_9AGAR|nr:thioesterase-like superfamily-domain-containing protein [Mycena pura]
MASVQHEPIATTLDVEHFDVDHFRCKSLLLSQRTRGVFGGQLISQALVSATQTVDPVYGLHSLHCYFLLGASASTPIVYFVERMRDGRSYLSRTVKATQNGRVIFMMMCSFQKPKPYQPTGQWSMPPGVPPPETCLLEEDHYDELLKQEGLHPKVQRMYREFANEVRCSPIAIKLVTENDMSESSTSLTQVMYWIQARDIPKYEAPFQKCILSYLSDVHVLRTAALILGLESLGNSPNATGNSSDATATKVTIDHSIHFYDDDFDCGDWLLYVMVSPRAASGRAIVYGQLYTRTGSLVAVTTQEGVVRADTHGLEAKL